MVRVVVAVLSRAYHTTRSDKLDAGMRMKRMAAYVATYVDVNTNATNLRIFFTMNGVAVVVFIVVFILVFARCYHSYVLYMWCGMWWDSINVCVGDCKPGR